MLWECYEALRNVTEVLCIVMGRYGMLQSVSGRYGTLRKRCGSLRKVTGALRSSYEMLRKMSILPITN